jgi:hypothetical protein
MHGLEENTEVLYYIGQNKDLKRTGNKSKTRKMGLYQTIARE